MSGNPIDDLAMAQAVLPCKPNLGVRGAVELVGPEVQNAFKAAMAAAIVRALAAASPDVHDDEGEYHHCGLCQANLPVRTEDHLPDCVWRQAVEWCKQNPEAADAK